MANKKKIRKNKKNKTKNMIEATFTTKKDQYANNIIANQQKYKLYEKCSLEDIEQELNKYSIYITKEDIIHKYETSYDINSIISDYKLMYDEQLNDLYDLHLLFDDECILLYVHKTIEESYPVNEIPEYHYITEAFHRFLKLTDDKKPEYFLTLLKTINKMRNHITETKISVIFRETIVDIDALIDVCIAEHIHNCFPDLLITQSISQEIFLLLKNYDFRHPEMIYADTLGLLAMHGYSIVEKSLKEGLNLYPKHRIKLYTSILIELENYYQNHDEDFSLEPLYQQVFQITPQSKDDRINLKIIQENRDNYAHKKH